MKLFVSLCTMVFLTVPVTIATAQEPETKQPDTPAAAPEPPPKPSHPDLLDLNHISEAQLNSMAHFQTETISRFLGVPLHLEGVLPQMRRADHPLQWINPFAPARYGFGVENVSTNLHTGRVEGISFLSLRF